MGGKWKLKLEIDRKVEIWFVISDKHYSTSISALVLKYNFYRVKDDCDKLMIQTMKTIQLSKNCDRKGLHQYPQ